MRVAVLLTHPSERAAVIRFGGGAVTEIVEYVTQVVEEHGHLAPVFALLVQAQAGLEAGTCLGEARLRVSHHPDGAVPRGEQALVAESIDEGPARAEPALGLSVTGL